MSRQTPKRLRITFVLNGSRPGGHQGQFLSYAREFAVLHQLSIVFIFPVDRESPIIKEFERLGVEVYSLDCKARVSFVSVYRIYRYFLSFQPQIIHSQHPIAGVNAKIAGWLYSRRSSDVKIICEQRNMPEGLSWLARQLEYLTFPAADVILCSSTRVEKSYFGSSELLNLRNFVPKKRKHYTFFNSIDTNLAASAQSEKGRARAFLNSEWGINESHFLFVTVAKCTKQKDYPTLISGFMKARQMVGARVLKLICLGDGPEQAAIRRLSKKYNLEDDVILAGYRSDVPRILCGADCFVLTSLWEGLPKALLEAMSIPLPCVVTQVSGIEDVIRDGVEGMLIPPGDVTSCGNALARLAEDPILCETFRVNAAERVKSFSVHDQAKTLLGVYDRLYRSPEGNESAAR